MASLSWIRTSAPAAFEWLIATSCALAFALTFGLNYPFDNQVVYFLAALRLNDPTVLARDWYAAEVTHYHPAITLLVAPLLRISPSGWAIAVLHIGVIVVGCLAWYEVCRRLLPHRLARLSAFVLTLTLMTATHTLSTAVSYVFNEAFQPSTLGSLGLLLAVPPMLRRRWLLSGVMLALSGLFHANYLILNIAVFGLTHLFLGGEWRAVARRLALQLGPSCLALAALVLPMLATVSSEHAAEAQRILFEIRSPHHYTPRAFQRDLVPLAAWSVLGLVSAEVLARGRALDLLRRWMLALLIVVWSGTLLTSWAYIPRVAQLFVWRFAPFLDLAGQTLFCAGLVRVALRPRRLGRLRFTEVALVVSSLFALTSAYGLRGSLEVSRALAVMLGLGASVMGVRWWVLPWLRMRGPTWPWRPLGHGLVTGSLLVFAWFVHPWLRDLERKSVLLQPQDPSERELFQWVAQHTDRDARFLSPPEHQTFRYVTQRAIVVDWKSTPMLPDEVVEWYRRLKDVTGRPRFAGYRDLGGYAELDPKRVAALDRDYGLDYVLVARGPHTRLRGLKQVYENARWVVFDVREP